MGAAIRSLVLIGLLASASPLLCQQTADSSREKRISLPDCGGPPGPTRASPATSPSKKSRASIPLGCIPPYETPVYTPPPDDGVALGSLLEASGYSGAAGAGYKTIAAGNFCGDDQKEIFLVISQARPSGRPPRPIGFKAVFSLLQGPAPHLLSQLTPLPSEPAAQWNAATSANLDPTQNYDQVVLIRSYVRGEGPNVALVKVATITGADNQMQCGDSFSFAEGSTANRNVVLAGAAVGNFDGSGKKRIAVLDSTQSILSLLELVPGSPPSLKVVLTQPLEGDLAHPLEWSALVAGNLDHGPVDELIAARHVSDNVRPTVVAFKWSDRAGKFLPFATSSFGNNGNSEWAGAAAGDFNADGRAAVVLVKNKHSNFAVFDLPPGASDLQVRATADLDSVDGQPWSSLAAADWLPGDQGASELIAVRGVTPPYRTNFFVYGDPFHRVPRDTGLDGTRAQWVQLLAPSFQYFTPAIGDLKSWLRGTHTDVFQWFLSVNADPPDLPAPNHDYAGLVNFLAQTRNWGVDGKQLRVWVTFAGPSAVENPKESCALPEDTRPLTSWNALDYFRGHFTHGYNHITDDEKLAACRDIGAWSAVIGRLAQDFPHLVAMRIDDFSDGLDTQSSTDCLAEFEFRKQFNQDCIATIESNLRSQAPWLNFVPTVYYDYFQKRSSSAPNWADLGLTLDSFLFFFRNEKHGICIDHTLGCLQSIEHAPEEIRDMQQLLPAGRKLQLGVYFGGCQACSKNAAEKDQLTPPQPRYDYDLVRIGLDTPAVGGVTAYGLQTPPWVQDSPTSPFRPCRGAECVPSCTEQNFLNDTNPPGDAQSEFYPMWGSDRYCALQRAFGAKGQPVTDTDLTPSGPTSASKITAYYEPVEHLVDAIFRSSDNHLHELWRTSGPVGQGDLTPNGADAAGDPSAYFVPLDNTHHVIFRTNTGHVHELQWTGPNPAVDRDLVPNLPNAALAASSPAAAFLANEGTQHAVYRSPDGHMHEIWWSGSGPAGQGDLTPTGPAGVGNPSIYSDTADNTQHVIYAGTDSRLHELYWTGPNSPGQGPISPASQPPVGDPSAYYSVPDNTQHVVYRSTDSHIRELRWIGPASPQTRDLTLDEVPSPANSSPSAFYVPLDFSNHAVYRSQDGHIHELIWRQSTVTHRDLTALTGADGAVGDPSAYFFPEDGMSHVFYRTSNNHVHELRWTN